MERFPRYNGPMTDKPYLRTQYLEVRRALQPEICAAAAQAVATKVWALDALEHPQALLSYIASKDNELDTRPIIEKALRRGTTVLVPVCMPKRTLAWSVLSDLHDVAPSAFGVLEPRPDTRECVIPPADAPVLVPGIAFDSHGYRIGYGAGYFDRFLADHAGPKIGLAYECLMTAQLPHEPHDVPMDFVVTEERVRICFEN